MVVWKIKTIDRDAGRKDMKITGTSVTEEVTASSEDVRSEWSGVPVALSC